MEADYRGKQAITQAVFILCVAQVNEHSTYKMKYNSREDQREERREV